MICNYFRSFFKRQSKCTQMDQIPTAGVGNVVFSICQWMNAFQNSMNINTSTSQCHRHSTWSHCSINFLSSYWRHNELRRKKQWFKAYFEKVILPWTKNKTLSMHFKNLPGAIDSFSLSLQLNAISSLFFIRNSIGKFCFWFYCTSLSAYILLRITFVHPLHFHVNFSRLFCSRLHCWYFQSIWRNFNNYFMMLVWTQ